MATEAEVERARQWAFCRAQVLPNWTIAQAAEYAEHERQHERERTVDAIVAMVRVGCIPLDAGGGIDMHIARKYRELADEIEREFGGGK